MIDVTLGLSLLLASAQAEAPCFPEPVQALEEDAETGFSVQLFVPCEGDDAGALIQAIVSDWGASDDKIEDFDLGFAVVIVHPLMAQDDGQRAVLVYAKDVPDGVEPSVCRIVGPVGVDGDIPTLFAWCIGYVGGSTPIRGES